MASKKKYTYPVSVTLKKDGKVVHSAATQLYQIGVYIIENNDSARQGSLTPAQAVKYMKQFKPDNLVDGVTAEFGREITVQEVDGFWKEIKEEATI